MKKCKALIKAYGKIAELFPYIVFVLVVLGEILTFLPGTGDKTVQISDTVYAQTAVPDETVGISVGARSAVLIDAKSGDVLFSKNMSERLPMASTTKIMTALCVIESGIDLETPFVVTEKCVGAEGSSIYLRCGECITVKELLYGLLLESGNDAAEALAVCVGGSVENFTAIMNDKASEMGLCDTHFDNPHGLSSETHYTTAYELAKITAQAMKNSIFREIVSTKSYFIPERDGLSARYFSNHNKLLRSEKACIGVKTGYTKNSGRCLVTAFEKENGEYIAVTLDDASDWHDHRKMMAYAENFFSVKIAGKGEFFRFFCDGSGKCGIITNPDGIYITLNASEYEKYIQNSDTVITFTVPKNCSDGLSSASLEVDIAGKKRSFPLVQKSILIPEN